MPPLPSVGSLHPELEVPKPRPLARRRRAGRGGPLRALSWTIMLVLWGSLIYRKGLDLGAIWPVLVLSTLAAGFLILELLGRKSTNRLIRYGDAVVAVNEAPVSDDRKSEIYAARLTYTYRGETRTERFLVGSLALAQADYLTLLIDPDDPKSKLIYETSSVVAAPIVPDAP